ncbi:diguanylate cyclase [Mycolicibacterium gilvum]|uniref:diguanylate cyclase n=1 Tax=Mycolicibacterium gilvum TaxID=1804 RepID=UPI004045EA27
MPRQLSVVAGLSHWWRQADHYDWFAEYLRARGLIRLARVITAVTAAGLALVGVTVMLCPGGPTGTLFMALGWAAIALALGCAVVRLSIWPSKRQSVVLILALNLSIAVFCQIQTDQLIGVVGATAFATTGTSIACLHSAKYMLYNVVVATYIGVLQAVRAMGETDGHLILAALGLVLIVNIAVPFSVQSLVHALGGDVVQSDRDPLTGLLHRRALFRQINALIASHRDHADFLAVTMIDLDKFKVLNDTYGHSAGDDALIAVGEALLSAANGRALVGRVGGEEFMVAELCETAHDTGLSERLRAAIAALPQHITGSVGTAVASINDVPTDDFQDLVVTLFRRSDRAMYEAKRAGGNQIRHTVIDLPAIPVTGSDNLPTGNRPARRTSD